MTTLMSCGHAAQGEKEKAPICVVCFGIDPRATEIADVVDLTGRKVRCVYDTPFNWGKGKHGHAPDDSVVDTNLELAFLYLRNDGGMDGYYCGCWGWN